MYRLVPIGTLQNVPKCYKGVLIIKVSPNIEVATVGNYSVHIHDCIMYISMYNGLIQYMLYGICTLSLLLQVVWVCLLLFR